MTPSSAVPKERRSGVPVEGGSRHSQAAPGFRLPTPEPPTVVHGTGDVTLCVYALTGSAARVSAVGLSGERLRLVREGSIAAVVGELARAPRPSHESLRHYDRTMRAISAVLPAVLPARFGACFDDLDELRFILRSRRASLRRAVAHVRNRVQMTVRVLGRSGPPAAFAREARAPFSPPAGLRAASLQLAGPGTGYLRTRADAAARERDVPGFEPVREAVRRWVRDERIEKRAQVTSVYHLVPRASADAYRRAVDRATMAAALQVI